MNDGRKTSMIGHSFGLLLIIVWQAAAFLIGKAFILPGPLDVLDSLWKNRAELFLVHFPATMQVVLLGSFFSVVLGLFFAILMDLDERIERALYPILTVTQTIPVMCIAPVFVLWFGYTVKMRVIVVVLVNFFAVTVNVFDGFRAAGKQKAELLTVFGASRREQFFYLRFPTALPYFFTALRIAVPWSVIGAAVAEWLGAPSGLGTASRTCMMSFDAAGLLAPLVILTVTALLMNAVLVRLEKKYIFWREYL